MKPKVEIMRQWAAALRSGEYEQTRDTLRDEVGYCCLGVLCDLYAKAHPGEDPFAQPEYCPRANELPPDVSRWAGLDTSNPSLRRHGERYAYCATHWNDVVGATFPEIADMVEGTFCTEP